MSGKGQDRKGFKKEKEEGDKKGFKVKTKI